MNLRDIPEPWRSFLHALDELATAETRLDCMGGFVVTQLYGSSRTTADLDVMEIAPREQLPQLLDAGRQGGALHRKHKVHLDLAEWETAKQNGLVSDIERMTRTELVSGGSLASTEPNHKDPARIAATVGKLRHTFQLYQCEINTM